MLKMTLKNVSKNDWKLIIGGGGGGEGGGVGIKMTWMGKNRKINNRGERLFGTREWLELIVYN